MQTPDMKEWEKELDERPHYHTKPNGEPCSSQLVDANDEPAELPCDCGLNDFITGLLHQTKQQTIVEMLECVPEQVMSPTQRITLSEYTHGVVAGNNSARNALITYAKEQGIDV